MIVKLCKLVSYLLHPLLMPTLMFGIIYFYMPALLYPMNWLALPFLFFSTFLVPSISIYMLKLLGSIRSLEMRSREERILPFICITMFYGMTAYMFIYNIQVNDIVATIFLSTCGLLVVISLITFWFKISVHSAGVSGVLGLLIALTVKNPEHSIVYPTMALIVLVGLVMSARLRLDAHRPIEVWTGTLLGGVSCFGLLYYFG